MARNSRDILSQSSSEENKRQHLIESKVEPIRELLEDGMAEIAARPARKKSELEILNSEAIASCLFSKAPIEFLEQKTLAELAHATRKGIEVVDRALQRQGEPAILIEQAPERTALWIALGDRPFVVNSINECISASKLAMSVFLHPILLRGDLRVSLSYVEFARLSDDQAALLKQRLERCFADLMLATDDFTAVLVRTETLARVLDNPGNRATFTDTEKREVSEFLRWLVDGNFVFLGHAEWRLERDKLEERPAAALGIFKSAQSYRDNLINESRQDAITLVDRSEPILVTRLDTESPVHRIVRMVNVTVQEISTEGRVVAVHSFVGMLTSKARAQESSSVPLIRRKLQRLIELEEVVHNSHDYKYLVDIIDSMPKDEALRMDIEALREVVHTILGIQHKNETRISVRFDAGRRGASVLIVMPRDRFNSQVRQRVQAYIESVFGAVPGTSEYHLNYTNRPLVRFYFYVPLFRGELRPVNLRKVQLEVADISRTWRDNVRERIFADAKMKDPEARWLKYADAFPADYQAVQNVDDCSFTRPRVS